jgi:hypothetical protein
VVSIPNLTCFSYPLDFTKIWPDAELAGLRHFFVEQGGNFTHDPITSITVSAEYVKRVLLKQGG